MFKQDLLSHSQFKALWPNVDVPYLPFDMPQGDWFCMCETVKASEGELFLMAVDCCETPKDDEARENW